MRTFNLSLSQLPIVRAASLVPDKSGQVEGARAAVTAEKSASHQLFLGAFVLLGPFGFNSSGSAVARENAGLGKS